MDKFIESAPTDSFSADNKSFLNFDAMLFPLFGADSLTDANVEKSCAGYLKSKISKKYEANILYFYD